MILIMFYSFYVTVRQGSSLGSVNNNQEALYAVAVIAKSLQQYYCLRSTTYRDAQREWDQNRWILSVQSKSRLNSAKGNFFRGIVVQQ